MAEKVTVDELLSQIDEFEKTISQLKENLIGLRAKLKKNMEKFGPDMSKWPLAQDK